MVIQSFSFLFSYYLCPHPASFWGDSCCLKDASLSRVINGLSSWESYQCDAIQHMPFPLLISDKTLGSPSQRHPQAYREGDTVGPKRVGLIVGYEQSPDRRKEELLTMSPNIAANHPVLAVFGHLSYMISFPLCLRASCWVWLLKKVDPSYWPFLTNSFDQSLSPLVQLKQSWDFFPPANNCTGTKEETKEGQYKNTEAEEFTEYQTSYLAELPGESASFPLPAPFIKRGLYPLCTVR